MGLPNVQVPSTPNYSDFPFYNYSTTVTINASEAVSVDGTNHVGGSNEGVGIIKTAASGNVSIGIAMENIAPLSYGRVRCGGLAQAIADGTIAENGIVDGSATAARGVVAHTAGKAQLGIALTGAADGDNVLILLAPANNA